MDNEMIVQRFLENYAQRNNLDDNNKLASNVFSGAIMYATNVFTNALILGGDYHRNQEDKVKILEHLYEINNILAKYAVEE